MSPAHTRILETYDDWKWRSFRKRYLKAFPICAVKGCGQPARHVDHIQTVKAAPHRRLDPTNVQGLCHSHHSVLTAAYDSGHGVAYACDEMGNPIDDGHPWLAESNARAIAAVNADRVTPPLERARLKRQAVLGKTHGKP